MKQDQLIDALKVRGLPLPKTGTGRNGAILSRDLVETLGDYEQDLLWLSDRDEQHMRLRRSIEPMKAYQFTRLNTTEQRRLWAQRAVDGECVAERKVDGWRMLITCVPLIEGGCSLRFWGGNVSDVNFLPKNYSNHVAVKGKVELIPPFPLIIDTECVCHTQPVQDNGLPATNTREAVQAILGSSAERAYALQKEHTLEFVVHDVIEPNREQPYSSRMAVRELVTALLPSQFSEVETNLTTGETVGAFTERMWAGGEEGAVVKFKDIPYKSGARNREYAIKIKRTAQQAVGQDIDAYLHSTYSTPEWREAGLIGGVNLAVWLHDRGDFSEHIIASISSMPTTLRHQLTNGFGQFKGKVVVVNGQELSSRNTRLMHATTDWQFREDKTYHDCDLFLPEEEF